MAKKPKVAHVEVHLHLEDDPPFHLTSSDLPIDQDGNLVFVNDGHPGFQVHFNLQGDDHFCQFPPTSQKDDAVWSKMGSGACPTSPEWAVFQPIRISPNRRTLVVSNPNKGSAVGKFGYTLRVVDAAGDWVPLDPGGDNKNGGGDEINWAASVLLIAGGALAGCVLTLGVQAMLQS